MRSKWIVPTLLGLGLGAGLGLFVGRQLALPGHWESSTFFREFSLQRLTGNQTQAKWDVLEDRTYEPFPALGSSRRVARRIIARAEIPAPELDRFFTDFQQATGAVFDSAGALNRGYYSLVQDSSKAVDGLAVRSRLDLPRRYYSIGKIHGVADIGYVAEASHVTVMVSLVEGL